MNHALAVVGSTGASERLVREAGELAAGVGASLTVLAVTDEGEYDDQREQLLTAGGATYSVGQAVEGAESRADDVARAALAGLDVAYETAGTVGEPAEVALAEAGRRGCDHLFVAGRKRSPTGKALFGDDTQRLLLGADCPVTVVTE
ncbi:universal stress protein [Candidatus Halobonum tyrrellensis]|uniref:UspA domain-containing protein n=1 Tax=Candidatus Halobonum tyrrellensis G22 TaxID=1324957 RepID=V4J115_9EURY|nr:universal stress protein [Candidatus Halobonum tyrrellensis]ESP89147.1 UspA domain-containing protein [Candidatus Halobonum tyrrellensis G22]